MKIINSVCSALVFPKSRRDINELERAASFLKDLGVSCMELYFDGEHRERVGKTLQSAGMDGVYIGVIPSKEGKLHLCDTDECGRKAAVKLFKDCMDEAAANGFKELMLNSGAVSGEPAEQAEAFCRSIEELFEYDAKKDLGMTLLLEPCDTSMYARQFIGKIERTSSIMEELRRRGLLLELTMDSAHTVEEGDDFLAAVTRVKPYCNRLHFANCEIKDTASPFYGDTHVGFEYENGEWTYKTLETLTEGLEKLYGGETIRIGLEVLCREDDAFAYFEKMWSGLPFLHKNSEQISIF